MNRRGFLKTATAGLLATVGLGIRKGYPTQEPNGQNQLHCHGLNWLPPRRTFPLRAQDYDAFFCLRDDYAYVMLDGRWYQMASAGEERT